MTDWPTLRRTVVELLAYFPADDVLAEIRRVLDDTRIPIHETDAALRAKLATGLDNLLREVEVA